MAENCKWIIKNSVEVPDDFQEAIGGHPLVAQTIYQRGYRSLDTAQAFLDHNLYQPTPPDALPDIQIAIEILSQAINAHKRILVWGDFDVDGQTSTTLLVQGLRELNANVTYHIPIRGKESHGISHKVLLEYLDRGFDLLLTCDTGISEFDNIQFVRDQGIQVIVTDHHALPKKLPPAHAIINPQRLSRDHPLRNLPGVGVAYKVMEGLFSFIGKAFEPGLYLELAALGIVADVAELRADTRYILQKGLINLRHTDRLGLQTLYANANLNPSSINESHIGFQIGPRLNAIGRLGDANPIVEFLITDDSGRSRVMGMQIEATNAKRRFESRQVEKAAEEMLQKSPDDRHAPGIVLHHPDWPGGIVGIVAGHLVEKYQKPVILLTGKDPVHGSARSVEGINIHEVISDCSDLLSNFGGHPMAAGLSMPAQNMVAFKRKFLSKVEEVLTGVEIIPTLEIDKVLKLNEITIDFVNDIQRLAPFGAGFPALRFLIKGLNIVSHNVVGGNGEHRQVLVEDTFGFQQHIIWWNGGDTLLPEAQFDLVCTLSKSDYRGTPQINVEWIDYHLTRKGRKDVARQKYEINDYRQAFDPIQLLLSEIEQSTKCLVWVEGSKMDEINTVTRNEIHKTDTLIIWTTPPTQEVLMSAIQAAKPKRLVVFGKEPNLRKLTPFLEKLAGLAKYTVHQKNGQVNIEELASACAVQRDAVSIGLKIWEARGHLTFVREGFQLSIELTKSEPNFIAEKEYTSILRQLIEESNAYRRFFQECDLGLLLKSS